MSILCRPGNGEWQRNTKDGKCLTAELSRGSAVCAISSKRLSSSALSQSASEKNQYRYTERLQLNIFRVGFRRFNKRDCVYTCRQTLLVLSKSCHAVGIKISSGYDYRKVVHNWKPHLIRSHTRIESRTFFKLKLRISRTQLGAAAWKGGPISSMDGLKFYHFCMLNWMFILWNKFVTFTKSSFACTVHNWLTVSQVKLLSQALKTQNQHCT